MYVSSRPVATLCSELCLRWVMQVPQCEYALASRSRAAGHAAQPGSEGPDTGREAMSTKQPAEVQQVCGGTLALACMSADKKCGWRPSS